MGICKHIEVSVSDMDDFAYANVATGCVYFVCLFHLAWKARLRGN